MSSGSDRFNFEEQVASGGSASFSPPITPSIPGNPGPDEYLQSDGAGVVNWAPKPATTVIPPGGPALLSRDRRARSQAQPLQTLTYRAAVRSR